MALAHGRKRKRAVATTNVKPRPKKNKPTKKHGALLATKRKYSGDIDNMQVDNIELNNVSDAPFQRMHKRRRLNNDTDALHNEEEEMNVTRVAVRQKVHHKLMLYFFEQLLIKHNLHKRFTFTSEEVSFGMDLFFKDGMEANKFVEFCESLVPCKVTRRKSQEYAVELGSVCKGDLVCLPQRLYNKIGGKIGPLMLCCRVTKDYHFIDPRTAHGFKMSAADFFKFEMKPLFSYRQLEKYTVLDVRITDGKVLQRQYVIGEVQMQKTSQIGQHLDEMPSAVTCHFSHIVHPGDSVLAYDFKNSNQTEEIVQDFKKVTFPDVIPVRKFHEFSRKRIFELQSLCLERDDDFEDFLDELEEDKDLRKNINLYKNPNYEPPNGESKMSGLSGVGLDELLEGLSLSL